MRGSKKKQTNNNFITIILQLEVYLKSLVQIHEGALIILVQNIQSNK